MNNFFLFLFYITCSDQNSFQVRTFLSSCSCFCNYPMHRILCPINVKPLVGGKPGKGGGFGLRSFFQFKCPTPGKLTMVKRVQILHPRDISVVQKNVHSPSLSRKIAQVCQKRMKHPKFVNERYKATTSKCNVCLT